MYLKFPTDFAIINLSQEGKSLMTNKTITVAQSKIADLIHRNPDSYLIFGWSANSEEGLINSLMGEFDSDVYLEKQNALPFIFVKETEEEFYKRDSIVDASEVGAYNLYGNFAWTKEEDSTVEHSNPELLLVASTNVLIEEPSIMDKFLEELNL